MSLMSFTVSVHQGRAEIMFRDTCTVKGKGKKNGNSVKYMYFTDWGT